MKHFIGLDVAVKETAILSVVRRFGTRAPYLEQRAWLAKASVYAAVWRCSKRRFSMVLALISFRVFRMASALPR